MLAAPIILYDYPQVAAENVGDMFDGTEIDEILTLRILTLTDEEKKQIRAGDARARELVERSELLPAEHLMKLHGVMRGFHGQKSGIKR
jgi:hydrogenase maturation protease